MARDPVHTRAVGQLLAAAAFWSTGGLLIKWVDWPPLAVAGGRGLFAALLLIAIQRNLKFTFSALQLGAALAYMLCTVLFVAGTKLTTAANAILLQYTAPIWVALAGAWFLGERTTRSDWLAIALALLGMALFFAEGLQLEGMTGNALALLAGVSYAAMTLLMRKQKAGSVVESIILGNVMAALVGLPFMLDAPALSPQGWAGLVALGIVQLGIPYALYSRAIRNVTALEGVLIPVLEPILNPLWVMLFLGERPGALALCGGLLVLTAVSWRAWNSIRQAGRRVAAG